jgi:hypothetical protein
MDVAERTAQVESELTRMIERRASKEPDPDELEPSYAESVRRYHDRERQEHLWQRLRFHERQIQNHTATFTEILDRHKAGRARCEELLGIGEGRG